jgi:hypothetical protein
MENDLKLKFTGKAIVLIEIDEYGPIEFKIDDLETVMKISKIMLDTTNNITPVSAYNKREENKMRKMLDF